MIKLLKHELTGTGTCDIPGGWNLGPVHISATSSGAGKIDIYAGTDTTGEHLACVHCAQYVGGISSYPIASHCKTIYYVVAGTVALADIWINQP